MNKKEILEKQNQRNVLSKKSREKILAALLAGSIATFTISPEIVSASTPEIQADFETTEKAAPKPSRTITYNKAYPSAIVLDNLDLSNRAKVSNVTLSNTPAISADRLKFTNNSIIIPLNEVESLNLRNTTYNTSINFEDGTFLSGAIFIKVIEDDSILPPSSNDSENSKPTDTPENDNTNPDAKPSEPGNENPDSTPIPPTDDSGDSSDSDSSDDDNNQSNVVPEINNSKKIFDYSNPDNLVIEDVNLKNLAIRKFLINGTELELSYLKWDNTSITILKEAFTSLDLYNGINSTEFHFSNGYVLSNPLDIETINNKDKGSDEEINKPSEDNKPSESEKPTESKPTETVPDKEDQAPVIPVMNKEDFIFNRDNASDIVLKNIDLKGLDITKVYIYGTKIDPNKLKITNDSITIPKEVIWNLYFKNGTYYLAFHFSNGAIISGYTSITITDNANVNNVKPPNNNNTGAITPPPNSNTNNNTKPPVKDEVNDEVNNTPSIITPEFPKQTITFNRDNGTDVVISNVNFKGLKLKDFYIYGRRIDVNKLKVTKDSIIIPKEVIWNLYLKNGTYPMSAIFENDTYVSGVAFLKMTDGGSIYPELGDSIIKYPKMIRQGFEFDWGNPRGINITCVNFNGNKLNSIKVGNKILNSDSFTTTDNSIHISSDVLESLKLPIGVYDLTFTFSNGVTLTGHSDLTIVHSQDVTKNETPIIIDTSKEDVIEIPNLIPEGTMVDSITINNVVLDVIYRDAKDSRISLLNEEKGISLYSSNPVVYVENGKIIIPTETLKYIGDTSGNYEVSVRLDNGTAIIQELTIQSEPDEKDTDNSNSNINTITNESTTNIDNAATIANNLNASINQNTSSNNAVSSPKTGDATNLGLLTTLLASIGGLSRFKRKRK